MSDTLAAVATAVFIYVTVGFALSVHLKRNDIADVMWGPGILLACLVAAGATGARFQSNPIVFWMCGLVAIWAARLAWQIGGRFLAKSEEDFRYAQWRKTWTWFYVRSYAQVFLLQGALMVAVAMVAIAASFYDTASTYSFLTAVLGSTIFLAGLVIETCADLQLGAFVKHKKNKTDILTTGLWRYSRHPNYFGEVTAWWGLWIVAAAPAVADPSTVKLQLALLALLSPVTITVLILKVSGIPMLEAKYAGNPQFEAYKARTSAFVPWFSHDPVKFH
jgi:steroid 5-alpha reductase family enzyme